MKISVAPVIKPGKPNGGFASWIPAYPNAWMERILMRIQKAERIQLPNDEEARIGKIRNQSLVEREPTWIGARVRKFKCCVEKSNNCEKKFEN